MIVMMTMTMMMLDEQMQRRLMAEDASTIASLLESTPSVERRSPLVGTVHAAIPTRNARRRRHREEMRAARADMIAPAAAAEGGAAGVAEGAEGTGASKVQST